MTNVIKPLPKSLHTVTVLVKVAALIHAREVAAGLDTTPTWWDAYAHAALVALGMADMPDEHALREAAVRQLEKGKR